MLEQTRRAAAQGQHTRIANVNIQFHEAVIEMARNHMLTTMLEPVIGRLRWLIAQAHDHDRQAIEHGDLIEAIASGDPERAAALALSHVHTSRAYGLLAYDARTGQVNQTAG